MKPNDVSTDLRTFKAERSNYDKYKSILAIQGKLIGEDLNEYIENFVLKNIDKTPTMDKFIENPDFCVIPPFPIKNESDRAKWVIYIESHKHNKKPLDELIWSSQTVGTLSQKMKDYGMTSVRIH